MPKLVVKDAHEIEKKIPRNLVIKFGDTYYATKPGLELKANWLFGGGQWGITTEIIEKRNDYVLAKATMRLQNGIEWSNYGEASPANVQNTQMHKYLLHLAVTRAECRVLRMATASAYASAEEMSWYNNGQPKELPLGKDDDQPATETQLKTIKSMGGEVTEGVTQRQAKELIVELGGKK